MVVVVLVERVHEDAAGAQSRFVGNVAVCVAGNESAIVNVIAFVTKIDEKFQWNALHYQGLDLDMKYIQTDHIADVDLANLESFVFAFKVL